MRPARAVLVVIVGILATATCSRGQLANGYYDSKCGNTSVETTIKGIVQSRQTWDTGIIAALLRMLFHDCFVNGCDASILLDGPNTEKTAVPNSSVSGYDLIDDIKTALENECPGVVSCADIIVAATRDAVALAGGPIYQVQLGRRDGTVSQAWDVNLPRPDVDIPTAIQLFAGKGLNSFDMAILMGAHTVGVTHCSVIHDRLYNFNGTGAPDPTMSSLYVRILSTYACPQNSTSDNVVYLDDPSSDHTVDKSYYSQLLNHRGALSIDQALALDSSTAWMVEFLASTDFFPSLFGYALNKLAAVEVKTGTVGEIRSNCRKTN